MWFLMTKVNTCDAPYYIEGTWAPRTWPIKATYNDYGSIREWEEGPLTDLVLRGLEEDELGIMTFPEMLAAVQHRRLKVPGKMKDKQLEVRQGMVRQDVWQALLGMTTWKSMSEGKGFTLGHYLKGAKEFYEYLCTVPEPKYPHTWFKASEIEGATLMHMKSPYTMVLSDHLKLLETVDEASLQRIAEFSFIWDMMIEVRHPWYPSFGGGPQEGAYDAHVRFLRTVLTVAKPLVRKHKQ